MPGLFFSSGATSTMMKILLQIRAAVVVMAASLFLLSSLAQSEALKSDGSIVGKLDGQTFNWPSASDHDQHPSVFREDKLALAIRIIANNTETGERLQLTFGIAKHGHEFLVISPVLRYFP